MGEAVQFPLTPSRVPSGWIEEFCRRWKIAELSLFGSMARGDFHADSDVDVLVTFEPGARRWIEDELAMVAELQEIFGRRVDLVEQRLVVNPFRRFNILLDKKVLYPIPDASGDQIREGPDPFERDIGLVWDIVKAARKIIAATEGKTFENYRQDWILRAAVERCLITVGEAVRAFSQPFREAHPEIPWSQIIAERNILVHQYTKIEDEKVWRIATVEVPRLLDKLAPLLPPEP